MATGSEQIPTSPPLPNWGRWGFRRVWLAALAWLWIFTGCAGGPDYVAPEVSAPQAWHAELRGGATPQPTEPQVLANWWTALNDPALTSLIDPAIQGNLELMKAQARVREARARRGINKADLFPTVNASASPTRSCNRQNAGGGDTQDMYATGFDATWEPDVFRRVRRSVEAATAELYPKFSLLGSNGLSALDLTNLLSATSRANSIGPSVSWHLSTPVPSGRISRSSPRSRSKP